MSSYKAPLKDMHFALRELAGLDEIGALPGYQDATPELVEQILTEGAKFSEEVLEPLNRVGDQERARWAEGKVTTPRGYADAYAKFVEAGWNAIGADPEYGGQGLPHVVHTAMQEMWNSANMAFCLAPMLTSGVLEAFGHHANDEQRRRFVPKLVSGEWTGTMNLTEPQAGSDLSAVRMQATPEGDHYRLKGTKIFITWGDHDLTQNIIHLVLARTPKAPEGVKGISLFIVPKVLVKSDGTLGEPNDIKCVSIEHKLGIHGSPTCVLAYGEDKGAVGYLVGEENRGLEYMFTVMNHARLGVGVEGVGIAERAYQHALEYARTRVQGRGIGQRSGDRVTIIHHPDVRRMLLLMKSQVEAMRALAYVAAARLDKASRHPDAAEQKLNKARVDLLTPIVKGWCTEQAVEIASIGIQVHGGMGFIEESGAAQYLRDARVTTIYEGTTGIQANDLVSRKVAMEKGATALGLAADIRTLDAQLAGELVPLRAPLSAALDAYEAATRWIVDAFPENPAAVAAIAVPYLKLSGTVLGGALMVRAAIAAQAKLQDAEADREFLTAKIATARFYAEHVLPQSRSYAVTVLQGAESVLSLDEALF